MKEVKDCDFMFVAVIRKLLARFGLNIVRIDSIDSLETAIRERDRALFNARANASVQAVESMQAELGKVQAESEAIKAENSDLRAINVEYQHQLERKPDYQAMQVGEGVRNAMANLEPEFMALYEDCRAFTMTGFERQYALWHAVRYIVVNNIPGDLVECGVWRGGSMRLVAKTLLSLGVSNRTLWLYDTYEGMTAPDERDVDLNDNKATHDYFQIVERRGAKWAYAPIEEVRTTMAGSGYPMDRVRLVKGPVEQTIPQVIPSSIALLRLDTDWYSSTKHEIEYLYPLLSTGGVLGLDDYGHYRGAKQAIDEYFARLESTKPFLQRTDYSCRFAVKPS